MELSTKRKELPVTIDGVPGVLRSASAAAGAKYDNALFKASKVGADGKIERIEGVAEVECELVAICLEWPIGKQPTVDEIKEWDRDVVAQLWSWVRQNSKLVYRGSSAEIRAKIVELEAAFKKAEAEEASKKAEADASA